MQTFICDRCDKPIADGERSTVAWTGLIAQRHPAMALDVCPGCAEAVSAALAGPDDDEKRKSLAAGGREAWATKVTTE